MSRSAQTDSRDETRPSPQTESRSTPARHEERARRVAVQERVRALIDKHSADRPTMTELSERLKREGVTVSPSIQSSGRLNGFSYEYQGVRVRGSDLGRAYTVQGLQERKGVRYDPDRDGPSLRQLASRAPARPETQERSHGPTRDETRREREPVSGRNRFYRLNGAERAVLIDLGRFRAVAAGDLLRERYRGHHDRYRQDVDHLKAQRLVQSHRVMGTRGRNAWTVLTLTKEGKRLVESARDNKDQKVYDGLKKPREIAHDAALYRMYQAAAHQVEQQGGRVTRVVLDYELKREVYPKLAKAQHVSAAEYEALQAAVAQENGLKVVGGKIPLPDLRIEYETEQGERTKVDLELATEHYHAKHLQEKAQAGFTVYAPSEAVARLSSVFDDHDLVGGILSF